MEGCDFVLGPQRVRLSALEVTDLRGWFVAESSQAGMKLGGAVPGVVLGISPSVTPEFRMR